MDPDPKLDENTLPGCEIIGSGYDVLNGYYASSKSCRTNLFSFPDDLDSLTIGNRVFTKPVEIDYKNITGTTLYTVSGQSIQEYESSMNSKTKVEGSFNFFSSSVEVEFGQSSTQSIDNAFTSVNSRVDYYSLQLYNDHAKLLRANVKQDIDNLDLTRLFDTYGTHYLAGIVMGGVAVYSAATSKTAYSSSTSLSVAAQMSYKALVGSLSAQEETAYASDIKLFKETSQTKVDTKGGDPALGGADFPEHVNAWTASVVNYLAFIDFLGERSLIGIWELASTPERVKKIKDYYPTYCELKQKQYIDFDGPVIRAQIVPLVKRQFTDAGSGANTNLSVCIPDIGGGWSYLGQVAFPGGEARGKTLVVQEIYPGSGVLAKVDHWEKVWDDSGSKKKKDYNLWRGVAANPVGYYVLSDFFRGGVTGQTPPTDAEAAGITAVHSSCVVPGKVSDRIWTDAGSKANSDASVWKIVPQTSSNAIDMSQIEPYFISTKSHNVPPTRPVYVLKKFAVQFAS